VSLKLIKYPPPAQKGVSLIELLIAVTLTVLIGAAMSEFYASQHNQFLVQERITDMQQNVRVAMEEITKNIRKAGYGLTGHPVISVGADTLTVYFLSGSQVDTVAYYLSRADSMHPNLVRKIGSGPAQVFAEDIDSLRFSQNGQLISVRIVAREKTKDDSFIGDKYRRRVLSSFVRVRNLI
jgi:hypothetical protein